MPSAYGLISFTKIIFGWEANFSSMKYQQNN